MRKIILQLLLILTLFFGIWFLLSRVHWVSVFKIEQISKSTEKKLGELYWNYFKRTQKEIISDKIILPVDSLLSAICKANGIDKQGIKLHVLLNNEVNAFALPNKHIVIFSGLIASCENEAELTGIIGHELAHIQEGHVMKKLIKEVGLSVLISATGNHSGEVIKQTAKLLSSSAYDRNLEKQADMKAVDYLSKAGLPMEPLAHFLFRLANEDEGISQQHLSWISTHPGTKERAEYILEYSSLKTNKNQKILNKNTWDSLKKVLNNPK